MSQHVSKLVFWSLHNLINSYLICIRKASFITSVCHARKKKKENELS